MKNRVLLCCAWILGNAYDNKAKHRHLRILVKLKSPFMRVVAIAEII
jgi:hypothetical protein